MFRVNLHDLGLGLAYFGASLGVAMIVPQLVRTMRNRALGGVSPTSWALTTIACLSWLMYGVRAHEAPQIPGNIIMVAGTALIVVVVPARMRGAVRGLLLAGVAVTVVSLALVLPPAFSAYLGFAVGVTSSLPQMVSSIQRASRGDESAVSVPTWMLRAASQVSWFLYAAIIGDVAVMISATFIFASVVAVIGAELRHRALARGRELAAVAVAAELAPC
jgi:uncharacterized protein with PQ loop repeat